jgi:hypothetical protein
LRVARRQPHRPFDRSVPETMTSRFSLHRPRRSSGLKSTFTRKLYSNSQLSTARIKYSD